MTRKRLTSVSRPAFGGAFRVAVVAVFMMARFASAQGEMKVFTGSAPGLVTQARDLGPEDPRKLVTVTVVLQQRNQAAFQHTLQQMYTAGSPLYHQWLTMAQYAANYAPNAAEAATVSDFLTSHHLNVTETDEFNAYVTAEGMVADVQYAFHVHLDRFVWNGKAYRANADNVSIEGPAGPLIACVLGLDDVRFEPRVRRVNPATGQPIPAVPAAKTTLASNALYLNSCFGVSTEFQFDSWSYWPFITYTGQAYLLNSSTCAYTPQQVQAAYGLTSMYQQGYNGGNQAIGIVDAYGSPTLVADELYFANYFGLTPPPQINVNNSPSFVADPNWALETTMDIEYASAMAPGASIAVNLASDSSPSNMFTALLYTVQHNCGIFVPTICINQISDSWGIREGLVGSAFLIVSDYIAKQAASLGISLNFASGDCGDFSTSVSGGACAGGNPDVNSPASDPWVTAVGGASLGMNSGNSVLFQTGWGNNLTNIDASNLAVLPPSRTGFQGGSGGGNSAVYKSLPFEANATNPRRLPDVAFLADPYTGVQVVESFSTGTEMIQVGSGTSLATPMFAGLWAVANEYVAKNYPGKSPLGLATPYLYWAETYFPSAITDIQQGSYASRATYDVHGCEHRLFLHGCHPSYSVSYLVNAPGDSYVSALWHPGNQSWYILSFGTDTSLHTAPGWDNVTGVGVPNGLSFLLGIGQWLVPSPVLDFLLLLECPPTGQCLLNMDVYNNSVTGAPNVTITSITGITASGATFAYVGPMTPFVVTSNLGSGANIPFNLTFEATSGPPGTGFSFVITAQASNVPSFTTTITVP